MSSDLEQTNPSQVIEQPANTDTRVHVGAHGAKQPSSRSNTQPTSPTGSSISAPPILRRPGLGRSVSSPMGIAVRHASHRLTSGFINSLPRSRPEEPQWTIFGQMMGNEGQHNSQCDDVSTISSTIRPGHASALRDPRPSIRISTQNNVSVTSSTNSILSPPANIQSPVPGDEGSFLSYHDRNDDNSSEISSSSETEPIQPPSSSLSILGRLPSLPILYRNILKCAIAYFIGSLFTFVPYLSGLLSDITSYGPGDHSPYPSGHMVATVAVYFNPAKTIGGMVEADIYCLMALFFSAFVSLGSMTLYWFFEVRPGWDWLADALAITWIGVGMSVVAWMKVWMAKPSFNTACSMTAIILFVVVVKEGGLEQLLQVSLVVIIGSTVSNIVCYLIWPQSATKNLQTNMTKTLDSFSTLLRMLTDTFLLEEPLHPLSQGKLQQAVHDHQASFMGLKKSLDEAHSEWFIGGPSGTGKRSSGKAYEDAVDSLTRLAQHLNGLRSGTRLQYELSKAASDGTITIKGRQTLRRKHTNIPGPVLHSSVNDSSSSSQDSAANRRQSQESDALLKAAAAMFGDLADELSPPLTALTNTCTSCLKRLRESFVLKQKVTQVAFQPHEFDELIEGIEHALYNFESTSNHALMRLYRRTEFEFGDSSATLNRRDSKESLLLGSYNEQNEHIFLVYFFIFTLQEFAREMVSLCDAMSRIYSIERARAARGPWWKRLFVSRGQESSRRAKRPMRKGHDKNGLHHRISAYMNLENRKKRDIHFPKVKPHAPNTVQTPAREQLTFWERIKQSIWAVGTRLRESDMKYAIKAGMATAILAAPAFFETTRPIFTEYRGEWALISFFVVISPTIGATNFMGLHRVLGTLFGAGSAAAAFTLFRNHPVVLSLFGFFYSIPCFYYIVGKPQYATTGRFVLLTYNLTCLFCYNIQLNDVPVLEIAQHRSVAVAIGVVWAAIVSRFWWPAEARRELGKALGEFCLNMGWLYTRLVASYSFDPEHESGSESDPNESGIEDQDPLIAGRVITKTKLSNSIEEFMAMELHLQVKLLELQGLLSQTQHEPRLKGPFPVQLYRSILTSLQTVLDKLHSMRCVTTREEWYTSVRKDFIVPVNKERHEMVGNIILFFSTLSSAFRLKAPLPPYLPPAEKSRLRLVEAIRNLDVVKNRDVKASRQLLFFAYAMTMQGVTQELERLGKTLQDAFGVIGQSPEEFEALFQDQRRRVENMA